MSDPFYNMYFQYTCFCSLASSVAQNVFSCIEYFKEYLMQLKRPVARNMYIVCERSPAEGLS